VVLGGGSDVDAHPTVNRSANALAIAITFFMAIVSLIDP